MEEIAVYLQECPQSFVFSFEDTACILISSHVYPLHVQHPDFLFGNC